jgi:hypothetical protein
VLVHFDPEKLSIIEVDTFNYAISVYLLQLDKNGKLYPIAYFS